MSDTAGMVRLIEHTADRLAAEAEALGGLSSHQLDDRRPWVMASMALAEGVLRMVACSAADGASPVDTAIAALADYQTWAGRHDDAEILDLAALDSIRRYFETMRPE